MHESILSPNVDSIEPLLLLLLLLLKPIGAAHVLLLLLMICLCGKLLPM